MSPWYVHASKYPNKRKMCNLMIRVLIGVHKFEPACWKPNVLFTKCVLLEKCDITHVRFICPELQDIREKSWAIFKRKLPTALGNEVENMVPKERVKFLLSAFMSKYCPLFEESYDAATDFVYKMCVEKNKLHIQATVNSD